MNRQVHTICGDFDQDRYDKLVAAYTEALRDKLPIFNFEGEPLVTDFAKYLVEYLDLQFKQSKDFELS